MFIVIIESNFKCLEQTWGGGGGCCFFSRIFDSSYVLGCGRDFKSAVYKYLNIKFCVIFVHISVH